MSTATETCACGASITLTTHNDRALGWELTDWRREHHHDLEAADARRERDEARAEVERLRRGEADGIFTSVVHECCERVETAETAIARVREFIREHGTGWDAITTNGDDWAKRIIDILDREA